MSRALERDLYSLLPTYSQDLPQPLVELASSLLAQSRNRASTLKQEEEVARAYACCQIACERLKTSLDLPPIQPRPPVPPRVYNRLYTHLDKILPNNAASKAGRVRTPSSKLRDSAGFGSSIQRTPSRVTPSKEASLAQFRSPAAARGDDTPTKTPGRPPAVTGKRKAGGVASVLPPWVRPTIQFLCKELDGERIGKTVLAGMHTIAAPQGRLTEDKWILEHLAPLLAAIYFLVSVHLCVLEQQPSGGKADSKLMARIRKPLLQALERAPAEVVARDMDEDEMWIGWADVGPKDLEAAVKKAHENGWQEADWFTSIKHLARNGDAQEDEPEPDDEDDSRVDGDETDEQMTQRLHLKKADTMLQSRWVMTDKKREEYRVWKEDMMRRIEEVEARQEGNGMEIDATA